MIKGMGHTAVSAACMTLALKPDLNFTLAALGIFCNFMDVTLDVLQFTENYMHALKKRMSHVMSKPTFCICENKGTFLLHA